MGTHRNGSPPKLGRPAEGEARTLTTGEQCATLIDSKDTIIFHAGEGMLIVLKPIRWKAGIRRWELHPDHDQVIESLELFWRS